jgi:riboflavin kinase/FMN adenylyltransferase
MQTIFDLSATTDVVPSVLAVGVFDGVHLGHQALIRRVVASAHTSGCRATVITFFPHPDSVLGHGTPHSLTTMEEKLALFEQLGIDLSVVMTFTQEMAQVRAADLIEKFVGQLHMIELWAGQDFALGHEREGDITFLRQAGARLGFAVKETAVVTWNGDVVSSTRIREALRSGNVAMARHCLGRPFRLSGRVAPGAQHGRSTGMPAVHLGVLAEKAVPTRGMYTCIAHASQSHHVAVTSIDTCLTSGQGDAVIEIHLPDCEDNLDGQRLSLDFIARLSAEPHIGVAKYLAGFERDTNRARHVPYTTADALAARCAMDKW